MTNNQPIQFTRAAADQIRETVARQRTGLRRDLQITPPAAAGAELQTGSEDIFPVLITKDGGADGGSSTRATWTYTVKNIDGTQLATAVAVARARPLGPMEYGDEVASPAYGTAFYNSSGTLLLWDAGETQRLTAVSPMTNWQVADPSGDTQKKTRSILVPVGGAESDWTTIDTTTESDYVPCS